ncbi:pickpocket protein 28-like [Periplaneta americana]|uniref:pickpocket protein 28-like n=1 Tax=Periplaneta americana TaxID=6978 RepID=UPI0037E8929C
MISNRSTGPGMLSVHMKTDTKMFVLPNEEVPHLTTSDDKLVDIPKGGKLKHYMKVNDIENDAEVRDIDITKRRCRFSDENYLQTYSVYSSGGCTVNCRFKLQLKFCNCTSFYMPGVDKKYHCDMNGLFCLEKYNDFFIKRKIDPNSNATGFYCNCEEPCETKRISFLRSVTNVRELSKTGFSELDIVLNHLPTELFKRTVVRRKLDLVVSMGGAAGLLVGASLLSFAELFYHFTMRLFVNAEYLKKERKGERSQQQHSQMEQGTTNIAP